MSTAETEVAEAIQEVEYEAEPSNEGIDINAAVESIASDLFPAKEKKDEVTDIETDEEVAKGDEEGQETKKPEEEEEVTPAPQSWKKETHELWGSMTKEQQEQVILREEQMREGDDIRKEDAQLGLRMRDAFAPFKNVLEKAQVDPVVASQKLMATHLRLTTAKPEERAQLFNQLAQSYGVSLEKQEVDEDTQKIMNNPFVKELMNKVNHLEQNVSTSLAESQQEKVTRINTEVEDFASKHDYFDDLSDEIATQIRAGKSIDDAYTIAYRASPMFEQDLEKQREEKEKEAEKAKKQEAEKAKKAKSINVNGRDTSKAPTAPKGKMFDDMPEIMRTIKNRN